VKDEKDRKREEANKQGPAPVRRISDKDLYALFVLLPNAILKKVFIKTFFMKKHFFRLVMNKSKSIGNW